MSDVSILQRPIFIVSTGRCGSTLASKILSHHPDICSISEFWPNRVNLQQLFSDQYMSGQAFWELLDVPMAEDIYQIAMHNKTQVSQRTLNERIYMKRIALPSLVEDYQGLYNQLKEVLIDTSEKTTSQHILNLFSIIREKTNKKIWIERTGASLDFLPYWKKIFPNAKYIHIYRDGRNCAISMSKHPAFRLQIMRMRENEKTNFYNIIPLTVDSNLLKRYEKTVISIEEFGKLWNCMIVNGLDELKAIDKDNLIHIAYEDLVKNPVLVLNQLQDFIDPTLHNDKWVQNQTSIIKTGNSQWQLLGKDEQERLLEACSDGLDRLKNLEKMTCKKNN